MMRKLNHKNRVSTICEALKKTLKGLNKMIRHVFEKLFKTLFSKDAQDLNEMFA